jgi:hypothetical protein
MGEQEKYADKIAKMLRKAESTTPEEAEVCIAMAQNLMTRWAISEAMIAKAAGKSADDKIEQEEIILTGLFHEVKCYVTWGVVRANKCKGVYSQSNGWSYPVVIDGKERKQWYKITVTGYRSDIERVKMLDASLQIQLVRAETSWWRSHHLNGFSSKSYEHRERKQFIRGFANEVEQRLTAISREAQKEAAKEEAVRAGTSEAAATESVALVLRDREDTVKDWYDKHYGNSLRTVRRSYTPGSGTAGAAGVAAGRSADIGQPRVGQQGRIGRAS